MADTKILAIAGGFYFFGTLVQAPEGYVALENYAMFGGFSGGKGLPGVARGDSAAKVILDCFEKGTIGHFPLTAVYAVFDSIDLYTSKGTTIR
jgi:hypothetical protein